MTMTVVRAPVSLGCGASRGHSYEDNQNGKDGHHWFMPGFAHSGTLGTGFPGIKDYPIRVSA